MGFGDCLSRRLGKALKRLAWTVVLGLCSHAAAAHELEHHWDNPAYLGEMRLQVAAILIILFGAAAWCWLARVVRKRSRQR